MKILFAWIGNTDLHGPKTEKVENVGPIANAIQARKFDRLVLLWNQADRAKDVQTYERWLQRRTSAEVELRKSLLKSPIDISEIWPAAVAAVKDTIAACKDEADLTFHLSPGTPSMTVVWILLGKTRFPAELIQSSLEHGVHTANIPFDISAELLPTLLGKPDALLKDLSSERAGNTSQFGDIIYRSHQMEHVVARAKKAAIRSVPILIEGESGTGKELLATAIRNASPRKDGPFRVVNCGAISPELIESEIFGHLKGSFTGATIDRAGYFEQASGGTLFLDEIGELPLAAQVKLLRVLQEGEVTRVGSTQAKKVDVRVIAATNRNLIEEVAQGRFREDLFYRLAVLQLRLPALREREGELTPLIEALLSRVNEELAGDPGFSAKTLTPGARKVLLNHSWPGNIRELQNTLRRAVVWTEATSVSERDMRDALLPTTRAISSEQQILLPIGDGIDINQILGQVEKRYLREAMATTGGNKTRAARLLNLSSHQVLSKWLQRHSMRI